MLSNKQNKKYKKKYRADKGRFVYSSKVYNNPFFDKKTKKVKSNKFNIYFSLKIKIYLGAFFLLLLILSWILLYSHFFSIQTIDVNGRGNIDPRSVNKIAWDQINDNYFILFPQKNIVWFNDKKLKNTLEEKYVFHFLEIKKKYPHTVTINYEEKHYAMIWQEDGKYYFADKNGGLITEANLLEVKQKDYPIIENNSDNKIQNQTISVDIELLDFIFEIFKKFKDYSDEFVIDRFIVDNDKNTVKMTLVNGPQVYFSKQNDLDKQIDKLMIIKKEKLKENFKNKTYIDVRIGDSVYIR